LRYFSLLGVMLLFVVAISNSKFGGNLKFDAEVAPKVQDPIPGPIPESATPEELNLNCIREEVPKPEAKSTPVDKVYERKIEMR